MARERLTYIVTLGTLIVNGTNLARSYANLSLNEKYCKVITRLAKQTAKLFISISYNGGSLDLRISWLTVVKNFCSLMLLLAQSVIPSLVG